VTEAGLTRDASSEPASLEFGVWTAQFRNFDDPEITDVLVVSTVGWLAASLVPAVGRASGVRESGAGRVVLSDRSGAYTLLAHARRADELGRQALRLAVHDFRGIGMSDLVIAPAWETSVDSVTRADMLSRAPRNLTFATGAAVRAYAELYGLTDQAGRQTFRARFLVLRTRDPYRDIARETWDGATAFEFERTRPATRGEPVRLALDIEPAYLPSGTYLLRAEVIDLRADRSLGRATIAFQVR
jgi:hypothetical protein